ncbi:hypothetical protein DSECCO2_642810 [anaerobic digester metagenome]
MVFAVITAGRPRLSFTAFNTSNSRKRSLGVARLSNFIKGSRSTLYPSLKSLLYTSREGIRILPQSSDSITTIFLRVRQPGRFCKWLIMAFLILKSINNQRYQRFKMRNFLNNSSVLISLNLQQVISYFLFIQLQVFST